MSQTSVSCLWREPDAAHGFSAGVSLHSHTSESRETLQFIAELSTDFSFLQPIIRLLERRSLRYSGIVPDYELGFWTPPLNPRLALDLEITQIEEHLQLAGLVSLSDHDNIEAPLLLHSVGSEPHVPISVEWTIPFGETEFHLGVHNLPNDTATAWMERLRAFTGAPPEAGHPAALNNLLAELDDIPSVLLVFNHPLWDLPRIGQARHEVLVNRFLATLGQHIHALELNGLRNWKENSAVSTLAGRWNQIVISGGDRHGIEPNANVNLTHASTFNAFVHEVRRERRSHVLFMPQYAEPWKHRILQSTFDAIRDHHHFPEGCRRWDQRVYHPDAEGNLKPLSELWPGGRAPVYLQTLLNAVKLMEARPFSTSLRLAWNDSRAMRTALSELEA